MKKYLVAGLNIEITSDADAFFDVALSPYLNSGNTDVTDIQLKIVKTDKELPSPTAKVTKIDAACYYTIMNDSDCLLYYDVHSGKIIASTIFNMDYTNVLITIFDLQKLYVVDDTRFIYNIVGDAVHYILQMHDGFVLHSSAIAYQNGGVAFSAVSGTGKSTHTALWLKTYSGTQLLNDDTPAIHCTSSGLAMLHGTPWAGSTGINQNISVPLKAIVFLERSKENKMELLSAQAAVKLFFTGIKTPLTSNMLDKALKTMNVIFTAVPTFKLFCNMESEAAVVAKKAIFDETIGGFRK